MRCNTCGRSHCKPIALPSSSAALRAWRRIVSKHVATLYVAEPVDLPCTVTIRVEFRRPARPTRDYPHRDLDKLVRAILDAMSNLVYVDDRCVVEIRASKAFGTRDGVYLEVRTPDQTEGVDDERHRDHLSGCADCAAGSRAGDRAVAIAGN